MLGGNPSAASGPESKDCVDRFSWRIPTLRFWGECDKSQRSNREDLDLNKRYRIHAYFKETIFFHRDRWILTYGDIGWTRKRPLPFFIGNR